MAHSVNNSKQPPNLWVGQVLHFTCLVFSLILLAAVWHLIGHPNPTAFWVAVSAPILHQIFVWISWRLELKNSSTSKYIGFPGYLVIFFALFLARFVSLAVLAWLDQGSLNLPVPLVIVVTFFLATPGIYAIYSVRRYFGLARAAGADHFDARYQTMPLVNKGIFRFTNNGMYVYAFLTFWAIAIGFNSASALLVAAFSHAYIWVHYYATEKPDMDYLYGQKSE